MNIQEKIQWLENELKELKEEVQKEENKNVWKPKGGEEYYFLTDDGWIDKDFWEDCYGESGRLSMGNVFKTEEDVKFMVERLRVIAELKQFARPFKKGEENYYFFYFLGNDLGNNKGIGIDWREHCTLGNIYFESEERTKQAIEAVGEERIKKYYFQVED